MAAGITAEENPVEKIPVTNNTAMPIYVGSSMVPAGETRHFDIDQVPLHLRPQKAEPVEIAPAVSGLLVALLEKSVPSIKEEFHVLTLEELEQLGELEQFGQARKSLLSALADEILKRDSDAAFASLLGSDEAEIIANLPVLEASALIRLSELEAEGQNREAVVSAIAAEQLKRAG